MHFSLSDAANKVGMSRSSIYRLIDEGKLSATTDHRGRKVIELTELLRVFGNIEQNETTRQDKQENKKNNSVRINKNTVQDTSGSVTSVLLEVEQLRAQLQIKEMELKLKDREIGFTLERLQEVKQAAEKMQDEKDQLLNIIHRQTLLLEAPKPPLKAPAAPRKSVARTTTTSKPAVQKTVVAKKPATTTKTSQKKTDRTKAAATVKKPAKATSSKKVDPKKSSKANKKAR